MRIITNIAKAVILLFGFIFFQAASAAEAGLIWAQVSVESASVLGARSIATDNSFVYIVGSELGAADYWWHIEKRDKADGSLIWSLNDNKSPWGELAQAVAVDSSGVYIGGYAFKADGSSDWHIDKRSLVNGSLMWSILIDPGFVDSVHDIEVDATGIYVTGLSGASPRIEKRDKADGSLIWVKTGPGYRGISSAIDSLYLYIAIHTDGPSWIIEKRDLTTGNVVWSIPSVDGVPFDITVDPSGVYAAGYLSSGGLKARIEKRSLVDGSLIWAYQEASAPESYFAHDIDSTGIYLIKSEFLIEKRNLTNGSLIWTMGAWDSPYDINVDSSGIYLGGTQYNREWLPGWPVTNWRIEKRGMCAGPLPPVSWTDPVITANTTKIRKAHIDELRTEIDIRRGGAGLSPYSWTDPVITENVTKIRKVHFDELRNAISEVYTACGEVAPLWTDPVITVNTSKIRKVHVDELRVATEQAP